MHSRKQHRGFEAAGNAALQWFVFCALLLAVCVSALGVVYSTHDSRHRLNALQMLENGRNDLQIEWGQLLLEQSSLVSQGRVEDIARAELGMTIPTVENTVVVRR